MEKLKRAVIKEELVKLTGDYKSALVLNQLLYWTERVGPNRYKKFLEEESSRKINQVDDLKGGWVYKTSEELSEELMIGVSHSTVRRYLKELIEQGLLIERQNPKYKWDKTKQYRVLLLEINQKLNKLGYELQGYKKAREGLKRPNVQNEQSNVDNEQSNVDNEQALPEITTENTFKDYTEKGSLPQEEELVSAVGFKTAAKEYSPNSWQEENVKYYLKKYKKFTGGNHPKLKQHQWEKVFNEILSADNQQMSKSIELLDNDFKAIVDKHFKTNYNNCDYNILHFISGKIMYYRAMELDYL